MVGTLEEWSGAYGISNEISGKFYMYMYMYIVLVTVIVSKILYIQHLGVLEFYISMQQKVWLKVWSRLLTTAGADILASFAPARALRLSRRQSSQQSAISAVRGPDVTTLPVLAALHACRQQSHFDNKVGLQNWVACDRYDKGISVKTLCNNHRLLSFPLREGHRGVARMQLQLSILGLCTRFPFPIGAQRQLGFRSCLRLFTDAQRCGYRTPDPRIKSTHN